MKIALLLAATAALTLSACNEAKTPAPAAPSSAAATSAPSATPAATPAPSAGMGEASVAAGEAPTKAFMVGTWGEGAGCELPMTFAEGGVITDGPTDRWDLQDGKLTLEGFPQKMALEVVDQNTLNGHIEGTDKIRTLKRC